MPTSNISTSILRPVRPASLISNPTYPMLVVTSRPGLRTRRRSAAYVPLRTPTSSWQTSIPSTTGDGTTSPTCGLLLSSIFSARSRCTGSSGYQRSPSKRGNRRLCESPISTYKLFRALNFLFRDFNVPPILSILPRVLYMSIYTVHILFCEIFFLRNGLEIELIVYKSAAF